MDLSYFLARRIRYEKNGFSSTIHKIAIVSIGIGLGAAIVSFLIMKGFQETVKNKIYSFSSHIIVQKLTTSNSMEEPSFDYQIGIYKDQSKFDYIDHVQEFSHKAGLVKTENEVMGVLIKGIGKSFDLNRFQENMLEGEFIHFPDSGYAREVVVSRVLADKLKTKIGEDLIIHFFQNPPRFRRLKVVGVYETNLSDYFDNKIMLADIRLIQRLNDWPENVAGGLQVYLKDEKFIDRAYEEIGEDMDFDLFIERASDRYVQVFEWLGLISRQVNILLAIILGVVCVNMISVVLILVMERTPMIGMLKALGADNGLVQRMFVYQGVNLITKGLMLGNLIGLGLCWVQDRFKVITLNAKDYYMSVVPIGWHWDVIIALNLTVFAVVTLVLLIPAASVTRITPIKAIKFD